MSSLLEDIDAEQHSHLLEAGNLGKSRAAWSEENAWSSVGYVARISRLACQCGEKTDTLLGIFHREKTPSGAIREQNLALRGCSIPFHNLPVEVTSSQVFACLKCLPLSEG